jgi:hypothetical protein
VRQETDEWSESVTSLTGNVITRSLSGYTAGFRKIGVSGSVQFNLVYVPFGKTAGGGSNPWTAYKDKSKFNLEEGVPEWIIRNGVNDEPQDKDTTFSATKKWGDGTNGNGAVTFAVAAKTEDVAMTISDGKFNYPKGGSPQIGFTVSGLSSGTAELWYAVTEKDVVAEIPTDYAKLGSSGFGNGSHTGQEIALNGITNGDIYLVLFKDGELSNGLKIALAGDVGWEIIWGDEDDEEEDASVGLEGPWVDEEE